MSFFVVVKAIFCVGSMYFLIFLVLLHYFSFLLLKSKSFSVFKAVKRLFNDYFGIPLAVLLSKIKILLSITEDLFS